MSTIITCYQAILLGGIESKEKGYYDFTKNIISEYLYNIIEIGYMLLKQNKDIMISFSKLDEVATLDTSYHKRDKIACRPSTLCTNAYIRSNTY